MFNINIYYYIMHNKMYPKSNINRINLRKKAYGIERRRNMCKIILEHAPNFPLGVSYKDIDNEFRKWVEDDLYISYDGKKIPTLKLFANQRLNEYSQSWKHLDEFGNLLMNFKTITRDNNPQKGSNQGESYNIPGDRDYPMFMVPVLQENGTQSYDMYSMKQPFSIDMTYKVSIITNKYELINEMNELVNSKFKSINCYIAPNNHYMPMTLESISDESEYSIDDIKYYSQTFEIKIKAYIIREEDFKVTHLPSKLSFRTLGETNKVKPKIKVEENFYKNFLDCSRNEDETKYYNKNLTLTVNFPKTSCNLAEFIFDSDMIIEQIETDNVYDFLMWINEEKQTFEGETKIYDGDVIKIKISRDDYLKDSIMIFSGYDPNVILSKDNNPESSLDDEIGAEEIIFNA